MVQASEVWRELWALVDCWFPRCVDAAGGFFQDFNRDWSSGPVTPRFVVYQARMTWVAATLAEERPEFGPVALHGLRELADKFIEEDGAVRWNVDFDGEPISPQRHAYGACFVVYALSAVHRATGSLEALDLAKRVFFWMEEALRDKQYGGYFELPSMFRSGAGADHIGTLFGLKSQNSHLHILEGFTELAKVWREPLLLERLQEVIDVLQTKLLDDEGSLVGIALADWTPQPWPVSYGHNIEASHLLLSGSEVLQGTASQETKEAARRLVRHTLAYGQDVAEGGVFNTGDRDGQTDRQKVWWVQAEALLGFARALTLDGVDRAACERALEHTWRWILDRQIDREFGGWYDTVAVATSSRKGHPWKAAYHDGRALLYTARLLQGVER